MRNISFSLFAVLGLTLLLTACSKEEKDYKAAVPEEALAVCEVDLNELASTFDLAHSEQLNHLQQIAGEMGGAALANKLADIISEPSLLGIDFHEPVYLFATLDLMAGVVMKVEDEDMVNEVFNYLAKERICREVEKADGYRCTSIMDMVEVAYDHSTLLLTTSITQQRSPQAIARFIDQRMGGKDAYFAKDPEDQEALFLQLAAQSEGITLQATNVDGERLLANVKRIPEVKMALRMAEVLIDAEAIIRTFSGNMQLSLTERAWKLVTQVANTDFLSDMPDWAEAAKRYGARITTLAPQQYQLSAGGMDFYMGVEDNVLTLSADNIDF